MAVPSAPKRGTPLSSIQRYWPSWRRRRRSIENGARASKLVARMPRQRSTSSGWTTRVQPSPRSSSTLRPVYAVHDGLSQSLWRSRSALQIRTGAAAMTRADSASRELAALGPPESTPDRCISPDTISPWFPLALRARKGAHAPAQAAIGVPPASGVADEARSGKCLVDDRPANAAAALHGSHFQELAVFGDRAARDLQPLADEEARDLRVGKRVGRVLGVDHSLDYAADRRRRAGGAARRGHLAREEVLQLEHADGRRHVLVVGDAGDRRLVQAKLGRDLAQAERLHRHRAELEEVLLALQDRLGDHQDRREALLHVLDRPARLLQMLGELAVLAVAVLLEHRGVGLVQLDARHHRPV